MVPMNAENTLANDWKKCSWWSNVENGIGSGHIRHKNSVDSTRLESTGNSEERKTEDIAEPSDR